MKTVMCKYPSYYKEYAFKTCVEGVKAGDVLVVKASTGLGLVEVISVDREPNARATKWAFQLVDELLLSSLEAAEARRRDLLSLLKRKADTKVMYSKFEAVAAADDEARDALLELRSIDEQL